MGRYYYGDIEGKFMFAVQSSDAGERFGAYETPQEPTSIDYAVSKDSYDKLSNDRTSRFRDSSRAYVGRVREGRSHGL